MLRPWVALVAQESGRGRARPRAALAALWPDAAAAGPLRGAAQWIHHAAAGDDDNQNSRNDSPNAAGEQSDGAAGGVRWRCRAATAGPKAASESAHAPSLPPKPLPTLLLQHLQHERRHHATAAAAAADESSAISPSGQVASDTASGARAQDEAALERVRWRHVVGTCAASALLMYATRASISTAIVPMAAQFGWDKAFSGTVLSSFFVGYLSTGILGGRLADKYGGSAVLAAGLLGWTVCAAVTPWAAAHSTGALLAARAGLGMAQGVAFPAMHSLLARSVPERRRSGAIGAIMALAHCGTAMAFGLSPMLCELGGWELSLTGFAALAALWGLPWLRMDRELRRAGVGGGFEGASGVGTTAGASKPNALSAATLPPKPQLQQQHQQQQLQPIQQQETPQQQQQSPQQQQAWEQPASLWQLACRPEVAAIAGAQYCSAFGFFGLLAWLPSFFLEHCGVELSQLGGYTLAPYLLQAAVCATSGAAADYLIQRRRWPVRSVRVAMQLAAMLTPAAALALAASPNCAASPGAAVALITLGMGFTALGTSGVSASHLDVAPPRYAGTVFSLGNTAGTLAGLVAVPATGYVLHATGSWALAFGLAALHNVVGAAAWARWAGGSRVPGGGALSEAAAAAAIREGEQAGGSRPPTQWAGPMPPPPGLAAAAPIGGLAALPPRPLGAHGARSLSVAAAVDRATAAAATPQRGSLPPAQPSEKETACNAVLKL